LKRKEKDNMMNTKTILKLALCMVFSVFLLKGHAQQEPMYTHYMFNSMSVNPAYAGTRNALNMSMQSRLQWIGMEGAPNTHNLSFHTPINNKRVGLGFSITDDEIGPLRNTYLNLNYAYRVKLNEEWTLSMGIKGGLNSFYLGLGEVSLNEMNDEAFLNNTQKRLVPNVGMGLYAYNDQMYAGIAAPKLIETRLDNEDMENVGNELKRHYYLIAGYVMDVNSDLKFKPSVLSKLVMGAPASVDVSAMFLFREQIWFGTSYRIGDALSFLFDVKVNKQLTAGLSYDVTLNQMGGYSGGTWELLISYDFDGFTNNKLKSPRYF